MNDEFSKTSHQTKWLPVSQLSVIWVSAQRDFDAGHAKNIADNFDPEMFGVLSVTKPNGEGVYHLIDGQHRKDAVQQLWGESEKVPCVIFNCDDPARAAQLFDKINTARKNPRPIDRFRVRVTARYHDECGVARIVNLAGYKVSPAVEDNAIRCVDALVSIYKQHSPTVLTDTLTIIRATFGPDPHATEASLVRGYGAFLASFSHQVDTARLIHVIKKYFTPGQLLSAAKSAREMNRTSLSAGVAYVLMQHYNKGKRSRQLDAETKKSAPNGTAPNGNSAASARSKPAHNEIKPSKLL